MNGQHVETFEDDLSFTSDTAVSHDQLETQEELQGTTVYC